MISPKIIILVAVLAGGMAYAQPGSWHRLEETKPRLGTLVRIVLYTPDSVAGRLALQTAFAEIDRLNAIISDYDPQSELSLLNANPDRDTLKVSSDLMEVLVAAQSIYRNSGGAFDPSIKPCVDYWRTLRRSGKPLRPSHLKRQLQKVGYGALYLDDVRNRLYRGKKGMQLDLGGIGKGFIGDRVIELLARMGIQRALIDLGGDLVAGKAPPGTPGWPIQFPPRPDCRLLLHDQALAGSGSTYQYIERHGVRYSHIIDPRSGLGIARPTLAFVLAPNGRMADGWASALTVLGKADGIDQKAVVWYLADGEQSLASPEFNRYLHCQNE